MTDEAIELEFAYTSWADSCQDPSPMFRECRRPRGHDNDHASGFGAALVRWT